MPTIAFSDAKLRSLPLPAKGQADYWDEHFPAFGVRVSQGGAKTFVLNIDNARRTLGRFGILGLAEARIEARRQLAERTLGKVRPRPIAFKTALDSFLEEKRKTRRKSTVDTLEDRLTRHFPFKGQLADLTHSDVQRRLARIPTNSEHDHALSAAKTFFTWAHNKRYIDDNPTRGIAPRGHVSRARVLTDDELRAVWTAAEQLRDRFGAIVRLLICTGLRRNECASLRTSFIDGQVATLPAEVVKNKNEFVFPIPTLAQEILRGTAVDTTRNDALFFPARGKPNKPFNGWSKSMKARREILGEDFKHWTLHDLRRTYRTTHGKIGTPPHIAERLVNHISAQSDVEKIYNRWKHLPEMSQAVVAYEAYLSQVLRLG